MKKRNIAVLLLAFVFLFLPSCVPVPENVQQDVDALKQAHEEEQKIEKKMNFVKISDIYESTPKKLEYRNGVININARVCLPKAEQAYKLKLEPNNLYPEKENAAKFLLDGGKNVAGIKAEIEDVPPGTAVIEANGYVNDKFAFSGRYSAVWGQKEVYFTRCGKIYVHNRPTSDESKHFVPTPGTTLNKEWFHNEIDNSLQDNVTISNADYSLIDFWNQFQKNIEYLKTAVPNFSYKPYYMGVYETTDDANELLKTVSCRALYEYKGICFDPTDLLKQDSKNYKISRVSFGFYQNFHFPEDDCFYALRNSYKVTEELEKYDKILDLDSAISILHNSAAKETFTEINTVELMYGLYYYGSNGNEWDALLTSSPEFFAEPFWKFSTMTGTQDGHVFYVNALTGDFYGYSNATTFG